MSTQNKIEAKDITKKENVVNPSFFTRRYSCGKSFYPHQEKQNPTRGTETGLSFEFAGQISTFLLYIST